MQARTIALPAQQLCVLEGQLTWLVYIVGALIKVGVVMQAGRHKSDVVEGEGGVKQEMHHWLRHRGVTLKARADIVLLACS